MTTLKRQRRALDRARRQARFWKSLHLATVFLWGMTLAFILRALDPPGVRGRWWYAVVFVAALFLSILCVFHWAERHEGWLLKERHDELKERQERDEQWKSRPDSPR